MTSKLHFQINFYTCSESSKSGLYKTSTIGWFTSMLRIIQRWIIQNFHHWMIYKRVLRIIQKWIIQNIHHWMIYKHVQNHPKVDHAKIPILVDLETHSLPSKIGSYKSSKCGWFHLLFQFYNRKQQLYIIQIWMIYHIINKSSTFGWFVDHKSSLPVLV